jgi:recombination protein RecR
MAAWERFLQNGEVAPNTLRAPIERSWSRCLSAGVDPARVQAPTVLPAEELMTLRALHRELIEASVPIMAQAREFLSASGTILMLTDPRGIILQTEGDPSALEAALDIRLMNGANWTELNCGTNAIGTALSTREPVQVHACEHFCIGIKPWTCAATVVHDPINGEVVGALDVSGLQRTFNHHCFALVLTAADRIEERLMNREMELGERLLVAGLGRLSRLATGGLLFFDRKGRLIKADARADVSLTAMAIKLEAKSDTRVDAFSADSSAAVGQPGLPEWLLPEWVEPIIEDGRRLGTIVVLPDPSQGKPLRRVQAAETVRNENLALREEIVGASPALHAVLSRVSKVAPTNSTVLITGETGTGKEVVARAIHAAGPRRYMPMVTVHCGALTEKSPCGICTDTRRDASLICVVERAVDILSVEKSGTYRGKFHVLGGKLSPLDGVEPDDLRITDLEKRLAQEPINEIVIALGTDVEGDATGFYLAKRLARHPHRRLHRFLHLHWF